MKKTVSYYRGAMEALQQVSDYLESAYVRHGKMRSKVADDIFGAVECISTNFNVENAKRLGDWPERE
jgi:hypothetical protein